MLNSDAMKITDFLNENIREWQSLTESQVEKLYDLTNPRNNSENLQEILITKENIHMGINKLNQLISLKQNISCIYQEN